MENSEFVNQMMMQMSSNQDRENQAPMFNLAQQDMMGTDHLQIENAINQFGNFQSDQYFQANPFIPQQQPDPFNLPQQNFQQASEQIQLNESPLTNAEMESIAFYLKELENEFREIREGIQKQEFYSQKMLVEHIIRVKDQKRIEWIQSQQNPSAQDNNKQIGNAIDNLIQSATEQMPKPVKPLKSLEDFDIDINSITSKLVSKNQKSQSSQTENYSQSDPPSQDPQDDVPPQIEENKDEPMVDETLKEDKQPEKEQPKPDKLGSNEDNQTKTQPGSITDILNSIRSPEADPNQAQQAENQKPQKQKGRPKTSALLTKERENLKQLTKKNQELQADAIRMKKILTNLQSKDKDTGDSANLKRQLADAKRTIQQLNSRLKKEIPTFSEPTPEQLEKQTCTPTHQMFLKMCVEKVLVERINQKLIGVIDEWRHKIKLIDQVQDPSRQIDQMNLTKILTQKEIEYNTNVNLLKNQLQTSQHEMKEIQQQNFLIKQRFLEYRQHIRMQRVADKELKHDQINPNLKQDHQNQLRQVKTHESHPNQQQMQNAQIQGQGQVRDQSYRQTEQTQQDPNGNKDQEMDKDISNMLDPGSPNMNTFIPNDHQGAQMPPQQPAVNYMLTFEERQLLKEGDYFNRKGYYKFLKSKKLEILLAQIDDLKTGPAKRMRLCSDPASTNTIFSHLLSTRPKR